jgi:hypothetical protein
MKAPNTQIMMVAAASRFITAAVAGTSRLRKASISSRNPRPLVTSVFLHGTARRKDATADDRPIDGFIP